jgi:hypothetical protein
MNFARWQILRPVSESADRRRFPTVAYWEGKILDKAFGVFGVPGADGKYWPDATGQICQRASASLRDQFFTLPP